VQASLCVTKKTKQVQSKFTLQQQQKQGTGRFPARTWHKQEENTHGSSAGYAIYVVMSWDRFLTLLTMFFLHNNDGKAGRGQPNQQGKNVTGNVIRKSCLRIAR
jgi:hypothetical protein